MNSMNSIIFNFFDNRNRRQTLLKLGNMTLTALGYPFHDWESRAKEWKLLFLFRNVPNNE